MPLIEKSRYRAPMWLPGGHLQTIYPALFRKVARVTQRLERLELPDGDFIDLAWASQGRRRLAILSHGLEADYDAAYMQGMAAALVRNGWDVLVWNFRGCGDEPNRLLRMYHSGATEDLDAVVGHALENHPAESVALIGFSLGGNLTLKYLGESPEKISLRIQSAATFSVPCNLACSSQTLSKSSNKIYMEHFLSNMKDKIRAKNRLFPGELDLMGLNHIRTFQEFDDRFTAPIHGFRNAVDYWEQSSCRQFLTNIRIPTLLVNALNDPFLGPRCYPCDEAASSDVFYFEMPNEGGHIGFRLPGRAAEYGSELLAIEFFETFVK